MGRAWGAAAVADRGVPDADEDELATLRAENLALQQQLRSRVGVQRERREQTDELLRRLDDLVTDTIDPPSPLERSPVHRPLDPKPPPLQRTHCSHSCLATLI